MRARAQIATAVLLCLMTDARVEVDELPPESGNRGWAGDSFDLRADLGEAPAAVGIDRADLVDDQVGRRRRGPARDRLRHASERQVQGRERAVEIVSIVLGVDWEGLDTSAFLLVLPYALARWASSR